MPMLFVTKYEEIFLPENMRQIDIALFDSLFICKEQWPNFEFKLVYNIFLALILFLLPIIFMSYAFSKVSETLCVVEKSDAASLLRRLSSFKSVKNENKKTNEKTSGHTTNIERLSNQYMAVESLNYQLEITRKSRASRSSSLVCENSRNEQAIMRLIESRKRVVKLLIVLVVVFFISWLPYHIVSIAIDVMHICQADIHTNFFIILTEHIFPVTLFLAHANSAQNPICFLLLRRDFLKNFKLKLNCFS